MNSPSRTQPVLTTVTSANPEVGSCGASISNHARNLIQGAIMVGVGALCPEAYLATRVLARMFERLGEYSELSEADITVVNNIADQLVREIEAQEAPRVKDVTPTKPPTSRGH